MRDSITVPLCLFTDDSIQHSHRQIIGVLKAFENEDPSAGVWPSQALIASLIKCHQRHVQRSIKEMAALGYITIERIKRRCKYTLSERFRSQPKAAQKAAKKPVAMHFTTPAENKPRPDSTSPEGREGKKEYITTTESTAARTREEVSPISNPLGPWRSPDKNRAVRGWLGWLGEWFNQCWAPNDPAERMRFWEECMRRDEGHQSRYLDDLTLKAKATTWYRERQRKIRLEFSLAAGAAR